jgi:hypothetical protein
LRDATDANRRATIVRSLASGDDTILSAILSAPPCLSGLSQEDCDGYAAMWRKKKFPDELARIDRLEKVNAALYLGGQLLIGYGSKMANPGIVTEAKKFKAASAAAIAQAF